MFETIIIRDGRLGKIHHCSDFGSAVEQAIASIKEVVGDVSEAEARADLNAVMEFSVFDTTVYIGQAENS